MNTQFVCTYCKKICKSKLSKSCHERLCELNPNKVSKEHLLNNAKTTNKKRTEKKHIIKYILFERTCVNCGKLFYIYDNENRKHFPKCCSSICSHSLSGKSNTVGTKEIKCEQCNNTFIVSKYYSQKYICEHCKTINREKKKQKEIRIIQQNPQKVLKQRILTEESIQKLREAGKKSAAHQSEIRRSKNEITFCELCESFFENVKHNEPIFNGWDADVILPDIKFAILWNGKVHYEPIFGEANFNRVINRDKIKLKEIEKAGYNYYIIKDIGKHNQDFVKEKFDEFIEYLKVNKYINMMARK